MFASFFGQVRKVAHFDLWKSQDFIATDFNFWMWLVFFSFSSHTHYSTVL